MRTLASAYRRFMFIIDPDWAIQNEIDAWIKIQRDPDIAHAIQKRRQSVAGLAWEFVPASDGEQDKRAGQIMEELFKQIRKFQQARFNLSSAIFRGDAWLFCNGRRRPFQVTDDESRLWWVPESLQQLDRNRLRIKRIEHDKRDKLRTIWEVFSVARERWEPMQNRECFIRHAYDQTEETLGYGRGLMQSIYFFWRAKEILLMQGLAGVERWGMGLIDVEIDGAREGDDASGTTNEEIVDEWIDQVNKMRAEHVLVHDSRDKLTVKDWPAKGAEMIVKFYQVIQGAIDRMILTSKLPTGGGDEVGSFGRAKVEQEEKDETIQADREAESESFDASLAGLVWKRNRMIVQEVLAQQGLPMARRPKFKITQQKVENPVRNMQIINGALNSGMAVQRRQAYEKLQLTMPQEGDEVLEPRAQPTGAPGLGLPPPSPGATEGPLPFTARLRSNGNGGFEVTPVSAIVRRYAECKKGETSAKTGCTPKGKEAAPAERKPAATKEGREQITSGFSTVRLETESIIDAVEADEIDAGKFKESLGNIQQSAEAIREAGGIDSLDDEFQTIQRNMASMSNSIEDEDWDSVHDSALDLQSNIASLAGRVLKKNGQ